MCFNVGAVNNIKRNPQHRDEKECLNGTTIGLTQIKNKSNEGTLRSVDGTHITQHPIKTPIELHM